MSDIVTLSNELADYVNTLLPQSLADSPVIREWDSKNTIDSEIASKLNILKISVLIMSPECRRVEDGLGSNFTLQWEIAIEQNGVTASSDAGIPTPLELAMTVANGLEGLHFDGSDSTSDYYSMRVDSLTPSRNNKNYVNVIKASIRHSLLSYVN